MASAQKILNILRHAKAEPGVGSQEDHARALTAGGREAARAVGEYLAGQGVLPQRVLCSDSLRTRQTWEQMAALPALAAVPVSYSEALYLATRAEILRLIAATPESVTHLMLIGHNPGLHELCIRLVRNGEEEALNAMTLHFPTCAAATVTLDTSWREIAQAKGRLMGYVTPKLLSMEEG